MQTFLPYPDFQKTAETLDYRRLGKQRVEAYQILNVLEGKTHNKGWLNHPAVKMWRGYEDALRMYMRTMILEWLKQGYKNTMSIPEEKENYQMPFWFGDERFHESHRSNLKRKNVKHYAHFAESTDLPYVWPVK